MKIQSELNELIASLSPAEKRYVQVFAQKQKNNSLNYLNLFFEITQSRNISTGIKSQQASVVPIDYSPSEKNYLYNFILKAMRSFHEGRNIDVSLQETLVNCNYLSEKKLYVQCLKLLRKGKEQARYFDRQLVLLEFLRLEIHICQESRSQKLIGKLEELEEEIKDIIGILVQDEKLFSLHRHILRAHRMHHHFPEDRQNEFEQELEMHAEQAGQSERFTSLHYSMSAMALNHHCCARYEACAEVYEELISLWEAWPERLKEDHLQYKKIISNYLIVCHQLDRFDRYEEMLDRMRSLPSRNAEEEAEQFQNIQLLELLFLMNTDGYDKLDDFAGRIKDGLSRFRNRINKAYELAFYHNIAIAYFIKGDYKLSLEWLSFIINTEKTDQRRDIQNFARLFRMIIWFEENKFDLLEYETINVERFLRKQNSWTGFESSLVRLITKLAIADRSGRFNLFDNYLSRLSGMRANPKLVNTLGLDELYYWAMGHLQDCTVREAMKMELVVKQPG